MAGGGLGNIGSAFVTVELDFDRALQEARGLGAQIPDVEIGTTFDQDQTNRELAKTVKAAEKAEGVVGIELDYDETGAVIGMREVLASAKKKNGPVDVPLDFDETEAARGLRRAMAFAKRSVGTVEVPVGFDEANVRQVTNRLASQLRAGISKLLKPAATIAALGAIASAASAATAGVVALVGALAPLTGLVAAFPALGLAMAQSMNVVKFSMAGVTEALGGLHDEIDKDKFAKLTAPAQDFVTQLDALKPRIIDLQERLQEDLFRGFSRGLRVATPLLDAISEPLESTARRIGNIAAEAAEAAVAIRGDLVGGLWFSNIIISDIAEGAGQFALALNDIQVVARPLVRFLTTGFAQLGATFAAFTAGARASGDLGDFFARTELATRTLLRTVEQLGRIFGTIFAEAFPFGIQLLDEFNDVLSDTADDLRTEAGRASLRKFFADGLPAIREVARLIVDLGGAFLDLGRSVDIAGLLKTFRKDLLPPLVELVTVTTRDLLPVLIPALRNITLLFIDLAGTSGPLNKVVEIIGNFAGNLHELLSNNPLLLKAVVNFTAIATILGAIGFAGFISGLAGVGAGMGIVAGGATKFAQAIISRGGLLGLLGRLSFVIDGLIFVAGAFAAVFGAIPAAIGAAVAVLAILYIRFRRVRQAVDTVILNMPILGTIVRGVALVIRNFGNIVRFTGMVVRTAFGLMRTAIHNWRLGVAVILDAVREKFRTWLDGVRIILSDARGVLARFAAFVRSVLDINLFELGRKIILSLLSGLKDGWKEVSDWLGERADIIKDLKGPIEADRLLLFDEGSAIMGGFFRGLKNRWTGIADWLSGVGSYFKGVISGNDIEIGNILLGKGGISDLNKQLGSQLGVPWLEGNIATGGLGGFLHPTSGWADTLAQVRILERMFGVGMTSGLRGVDTVAGAGVSQHVLGQAADFGTSRGSFAQLTNLATFTSRLQSVFRQVIWLNKLWAGGFPTSSMVPDHMDHVHLGWQARAAGGGVRKGQAYQWNERGKELFMPQQSGYVMNAGRTKELVGALRDLAKNRGSNSRTQTAEIHVHSNAADPVAVGGIVMSNLGAVFSRA